MKHKKRKDYPFHLLWASMCLLNALLQQLLTGTAHKEAIFLLQSLRYYRATIDDPSRRGASEETRSSRARNMHPSARHETHRDAWQERCEVWPKTEGSNCGETLAIWRLCFPARNDNLNTFFILQTTGSYRKYIYTIISRWSLPPHWRDQGSWQPCREATSRLSRVHTLPLHLRRQQRTVSTTRNSLPADSIALEDFWRRTVYATKMNSKPSICFQQAVVYLWSPSGPHLGVHPAKSSLHCWKNSSKKVLEKLKVVFHMLRLNSTRQLWEAWLWDIRSASFDKILRKRRWINNNRSTHYPHYWHLIDKKPSWKPKSTR